MAKDALTDSTLQKLASSVKRLEQLEDYPVWAVRVQAIFTSSSLWSKTGPLDSPLTDAVMLSLIKYFLCFFLRVRSCILRRFGSI